MVDEAMDGSGHGPMILLSQNTISGGWNKVLARKVPKPLMSDHRGRTWDHITLVIDEQEVKAHMDTTWGERFYFEWKGQWYAASIASAEPFRYHKKWIIA